MSFLKPPYLFESPVCDQCLPFFLVGLNIVLDLLTIIRAAVGSSDGTTVALRSFKAIRVRRYNRELSDEAAIRSI